MFAVRIIRLKIKCFLKYLYFYKIFIFIFKYQSIYEQCQRWKIQRFQLNYQKFCASKVLRQFLLLRKKRVKGNHEQKFSQPKDLGAVVSLNLESKLPDLRNSSDWNRTFYLKNKYSDIFQLDDYESTFSSVNLKSFFQIKQQNLQIKKSWTEFLGVSWIH